jgi:hypothetical protein
MIGAEEGDAIPGGEPEVMAEETRGAGAPGGKLGV